MTTPLPDVPLRDAQRRPRINRWWVLMGVAGLTLAVDQASKQLVMTNILPYDSVQTPLSPFLRLTYSENTGVAFGLLPQAGDVFLIVAFVIVAILIVFYRRVPPTARFQQIAIGLVAGGALGNALDRLEHGAVIDWVHLTIPGLISNVSNIADHAIVVGALTLVAISWMSDDGRSAKTTTSANTSSATPSAISSATPSTISSPTPPEPDDKIVQS